MKSDSFFNSAPPPSLGFSGPHASTTSYFLYIAMFMLVKAKLAQAEIEARNETKTNGKAETR